VRRYIEEVFQLKASEMTTEEFLSSAKDSSRLPPEHKALLKEFLEACDLVKFAKHTPRDAEVEQIFLNAKYFIEETKDRSTNVPVQR
jgi:hypothetical protein